MRTQAPEIQLPESINITTPQIHQLKNKSTLYVFNSNMQPIMQFKMVLFAGNWLENKRMQASLTASLLKNGTRTKTAKQIAETFDYYGASLKIAANANLVVLTLSCLSKHIKPLLELIKELLTESTFPENELAIKVQQKVSNLQRQKEDVGFMASKGFNQVLFGANNPYGYFPKESDYSQVTQADILQHYNAYYKPNQNTILLAAGDVNTNTVNLINEIIGNIEGTGATPNRTHAFTPSEKYLHKATRENSHQSAIRIGMPTIHKDHEDYTALSFLTLLFGGFFGSRLMSNIREDKGYTYGIYSFINTLLHNSYFCISTETGVQYTDNVLKEIDFEINRLKTELVNHDELTMVKNYYTGSVLRAFDGVFNTANNYLQLLLFNKNTDSINQNLEIVRSIDAQQIKTLAEKYYNFETMYKVIVG